MDKFSSATPIKNDFKRPGAVALESAFSHVWFSDRNAVATTATAAAYATNATAAAYATDTTAATAATEFSKRDFGK